MENTGRQSLIVMSSAVMRQGITIGVQIGLARLLGPEAFGRYAILIGVVALGNILVESGFGAAIVHEKELTDQRTAAAILLSMGTSMLVAGVIALAASPIANLFGDPSATPMIKVATLSFIGYGLAIVPQHLLLRKMRFGAFAATELLATAASGGLALILSAFSQSAWTLVAYIVSYPTVLAVVLISVGSAPLPRARAMAASDFRGLLNYSMPLVGFSILNFISRRADDVLIGRSVGVYGLGQYNRGYALMTVPVIFISGSIGRVMFPEMARSGYGHDLQSKYLSAIGAIAAVTFPIMTILAVTGRDWVEFLLGPEWSIAGQVLQLLAIVGLLQSIGTSSGWIYQAVGETRKLLAWGAASTVITVAMFLVGIQFGLFGIVYAYIAREVLLFLPNLRFAGACVDLGLIRILERLRTPSIVALTAGIASVAAQSLLDAWYEDSFVVPTVSAFAGAAAATGLVLLFRPAQYVAVGTLTRSALGWRPQSERNSRV